MTTGDRAAEHVALVEAWLRASAAAIHERRTWLTDLDAAIGDGDHGINLDRGFAIVVADLDAGILPVDAPGPLLAAAGRRILGSVGGASGALYGRALIRAGERLADGGDGRAGLVEVFDAAVRAIVALGHAEAGQKTMLDALLPALAALRDGSHHPPRSALTDVARAAEAGAQATVPMIARKGRASYLGDRSVGHLDPGAASSALLVGCLADTVDRLARGR